MSTRCQIGFYESKPKDAKELSKPEVILYRHHDGYPEGVLPEITEFYNRFMKVRKFWDLEYMAARMLQNLMKNSDDNLEVFIKDHSLCPDWNCLGYGISNQFHRDIEYFYAISPEGIEVYDVPFDAGCEQWRKMELSETR